MLESALQSLRDIEGVLGSFLLGEKGQLLARDLPSVFDEATLVSASLRLTQLRSAFEAGAQVFDGCTARFGGHLLVLRAAQARTLCVLCPMGTNLNTLNMGLNLVARRVAEAHTPPSSGFPPRPSTPPAPPRASLAPPPPERPELVPPEPGSTTRVFRGRPVP